MLEKVKMALRISTDAFDQELTDLIAAAQQDLALDVAAFDGSVRR